MISRQNVRDNEVSNAMDTISLRVHFIYKISQKNSNISDTFVKDVFRHSIKCVNNLQNFFPLNHYHAVTRRSTHDTDPYRWKEIGT